MRMWNNGPDIPREEQVFLDMFLNPRFQWIARDPGGSLGIFEHEPCFNPHEQQWRAVGMEIQNIQKYNFIKHMFKNIRPGTKWKMERLTGGVDDKGPYSGRYK